VKRVGGYLFDEKITGASTFDLHSIASLTFGEDQCSQVFKIIKEGLNINEATPLTVEKSLKLLSHLVTHGAERCVDLAWDLLEEVEKLEEYNTAINRGAIHNFIDPAGKGVDRGGNVRSEARCVVGFGWQASDSRYLTTPFSITQRAYRTPQRHEQDQGSPQAECRP
jgi:hypothetical protein